jgi:hypothetical protein
VQERTGVVVPAERDWPRMDPPNVLWFVGAYAISFAAYALLDSLPNSHDKLWIFVVALALLLTFAAVSRLLLLAWWWVPGGLAAALAVSMVPAVTVMFLKLIEVWPDDPGDPLTNSSGWTLAVALVTAAAGLAAFWLTRFSFLFALVIGSILVGSQLLPAAYESGLTGHDRATTALVTGALLVIVGVFLDVFGRRRDAFWFHALGWFTVAAGLIFYTVEPGGDPERGWIPMLIIGPLILIAAGPVRRATWAVYGVLGYYAPIVHYLIRWLDEDRWPFALLLLALGLSIFIVGMLAHRYGTAWSERLVRRPPPSLPSP